MSGPDRALFLLRELLQTPHDELALFPRRAGLRTQPTAEELAQAKELVESVVAALEADGGAAWQRVRDAWVGGRQRLGAPPLAGLVDPPAPAWIGPQPAKPSLGDPAPGTHEAADLERQRRRFVPEAPPVPVAPSPRLRNSQTPPTPPISPLRDLVAREARGGLEAPRGAGDWPQSRAPASPIAAPVYGEAYAAGPAPQTMPVLGATPAHTPLPVPALATPRATPMAVVANSSFAPTHALPGAVAAPELDLSSWTTARYAAFCAACSTDPSRAEDTAREYGLPSDAARRRLADHFSDRFDREPGEQELWERLVLQFRERLRSRGP